MMIRLTYMVPVCVDVDVEMHTITDVVVIDEHPLPLPEDALIISDGVQQSASLREGIVAHQIATDGSEWPTWRIGW